MHIKRLEICGFKSFVDRTVVNFDHDVTGIVGPNGCGKSNIVDAIRWCMGEQSPRQLRGKAMDDVIFSGSDSRKASGFAEVTLVFDNTDPIDAATLPIEYRDYAEIAVTRRLFRDGTSEYLVNKTQVRLKDITDLFLGTGVGTKAYSIVEQGKIGMIVSAKPEDRRLLIEEAAGITKYKHRKKQAEKKMDLTRQNLLRVGDIVSEIERNLASLKRQAAKAERYLQYRQEHRELVLHDASHKLLEIVARDKFAVGERNTASEQVDARRAQLDAREAKLEAARMESFELEQQTDKAQNAAFLADNEARTCEAEAQRSRDRLQALAERQTTIGHERTKLEGNAEQLETEQVSVRDRLEALEQNEYDQTERLHIEEARLRQLEEEQRGLQAALRQSRDLHGKSTATAAASRERLAGFDRRVDDMRLRRERLTIDRERFHEDRREAEERRADVLAATQAASGDLEEAVQRVGQLDSRMRELRETMVSADRELDHAKNDLSQQRSRLRALEEVHSRLEGIGAGTKALIETRDPTIVGLVADVVEAPQHLIAAFAGLLGDRLQVVVVRDLHRATSLLAALAGRGRATVVEASPAIVAAAHPAVSGPGIVGPILDELRFAPEHHALVRLLTDDALVVKSVAVALELRQAGLRRTLVGLDGTVIRLDGTMSGGSGDAVAAGLLQQKLRLRELRDSSSQSEKVVELTLARHGELRAAMNDTSKALDAARSAERELQLEKITSDSELRRVEDQLATMSSRLADITREAEDVDAQLDVVALERDEAERKLQASTASAERSEQEVAVIEAQLNSCSERVSEQLQISTERKVGFAQVREQANSARATLDRLTRSIEELRLRSGQLRTEGLDGARKEGQFAAQLMLLRERTALATVASQAAREQFEKRRHALDVARSTLALHESEIKVLRSQRDEAVERHTKHDMAVQRLALERQHLLDGVAEKFQGLHLPRVVGDFHLRLPPDDQHQARIQELANLIDRMGPVNLDAMEEYRKTAERFEFYSTQKADLEKALDDLDRAIQQMNRESKRLFKATFDSVNERFQEIFPKMFRGGRANLVLTNPDDMLETGIEIVAQPPGKKIGTIELMSGGEKALTAVSLIFAIFQHKPSPFCVLDEVDAPLDEANVTRFNDTIRTMTERSQFILITHIKRTMQSVDVLYGVTMQEPGVSRLVSVKVNESAPPRWARSNQEAVA